MREAMFFFTFFMLVNSRCLNHQISQTMEVLNGCYYGSDSFTIAYVEIQNKTAIVYSGLN